MSRQIQIRRGTATENNNFTGAIGEVTMDTTNKTLRVHDGSTLGGNEIMSKQKFNSCISNCITEIPQDIKLELNNGTLTLKAGSKFYMPNGNGVFTEKILDQDRTYSLSANGQRMLFTNQYMSGMDGYEVSNIYSGSTAPSGNTYMFWYDTTNNIIKSTQDGGTTWVGQYTFPLCIVTLASGTGVVSIDQVFNGFGFVGGTAFALPGVKGLVPNGRNTDGTLKNTTVKISSVQTLTQSGTYNRHLFITNSGTLSATSNAFSYNEPNNIVKVNNAVQYWAYCGEVHMTNSQIKRFSVHPAFHAVNFYDIANLAMPSNKYIDLTLGASGTTYTMPADGWLILRKAMSDAGTYLLLNNVTSGLQVNNYAAAAGNSVRLFMPVSAGDSIVANYDTTGATDYFRFIYANSTK